MKAKLLAAIAIVFTLGITTADAQIKQKANNQCNRIKQGNRSGELTRHETRNLYNQQKDVRKDVRMAKSDGKITPGERRMIKREQDKNSVAIYEKKHNNRDRF